MNGLNLVARKVIMSAALYYGADSPAVDDATYDRMTHIIEGMWDEVDPYLQWQLGGLEGLTTSGFDYKVTAATIGGAVSWYKSVYPDHELFILMSRTGKCRRTILASTGSSEVLCAGYLQDVCV
jgi:hypothetical protein